MASDHIFRAQRCLREAELALKEKDYAGAVRRSQEALELAVKTILRYITVEYPREYDVSGVLAQVEDRLPNYLRERLQDIIELSAELARVRGPALYGYEIEGIPARDTFGRDYAENTYHKVKESWASAPNFLNQ